MTPAGEQDETTPKRAPGSLAELVHAWRYLFLFLGLVLGIGLFYVEENWRGRTAWTNYQQAMTARGEAVTAAAFVPPMIPDEANFTTAPGMPQLLLGQSFAARYDKASSELKARTEARSNSWVTARTDLAAWYVASQTRVEGARTDPAAWYVASQKPTNQTQQAEGPAVATNLTLAEAAGGVRAFLSEADPAIEQVRAASARPGSRFNLFYEQADPAAIILRHLAPLKRLSLLLKLRASVELALGQTTEAASDVDLMLYLANACQNEPILISQLVRVAQLQLAMQPIAEGMDQWSDAQLREFQDRLGRFDFCADGYRTLQAERVFFGCGMIEYVRRSSDKSQFVSAISSGGNGPEVAVAAALLNVAPTGWFYLEERNLSRISADYLLPAIDLPGRQISPAACRKGSEGIAALMNHSATGLLLRHRLFSSLMLPSLSNAVRKMALGQSAADLAGVACALQRYRLAKGQYPDSLNSLTPQFIAKLPHDIIDGQPLRYRRTDTGQYVLYSVGWNARDDGGTIATVKLNPIPDAPARKNEGTDQQEGDWVWRPL